MNAATRASAAWSLGTADKDVVTVTRILGVPPTLWVRALELGQVILLGAHYTDELDRIRGCGLSIPRIRFWHTQAKVATATGVATSLVLQAIETYVVTYASDGVIAAG